MLDSYIYLSFAIFVLTMVVSFSMYAAKRVKKNEIFNYVTPFKVYSVGMFLSVATFLFFSESKENKTWLIYFADALTKTVNKVPSFFSFGLVPSDVLDLVTEELRADPFVKIYVILLVFMTPLVTTFLAYALFRDYLTQFIYFIYPWKERHIFNELNEKSINLAESIFASSSGKEPLIIFADVADKRSDGYLERAKKINAHFTKKTVYDLHYFDKKNKVYIFGSNHSENMEKAEKFIEKAADKDIFAEIYVVSSLTSAPVVVDAINQKYSDKKASLILINEAQIISYSLLFENPMFDAAETCNSKTMSVMVIGVGENGTEFVKASMMCGIMNSFDYEICMIDSGNRADEFEAEYGNVSEKLNEIGINLKYEFIAADVKSKSFVEAIRNHSKVNYVVVSLGNDELTVNTAIRVRRILTRRNIETGILDDNKLPTIIPLINSDSYNAVVPNLDSGYGFLTYGIYKNIYSYTNIGNSSIDKIAKYINFVYDRHANPEITQEESFASYDKICEVNKMSNRSVALHTIYKLRDAGIKAVKKNDSGGNGISVDKISEIMSGEDMQRLEHNRWSVFMTLNGWDRWALHSDNDEYVSVDKCGAGRYKHTIAGLHGAIISNDDLEELSWYVYGEENAHRLRDNDILVSSNTAKALLTGMPNVIFEECEK